MGSGSHNHPYVSVEHGDYAAEISTYGGGLRSCTYRGLPIVETYPKGEFPPLSSNIVLAPWPNRTEDGSFVFAGEQHQLLITEPERNNAIHGFVGFLPWTVRSASEATASLVCDIDAQPGWAWPLTMQADYQLTDDGLGVTLSVSNTGDQPAPFGIGVHTYLSLFGHPIDDCTLSVPVHTMLELDQDRLLPTGREVPLTAVPECAGLGQGMPLSGAVLDHCLHSTDSVAQRICTLLHVDDAVEQRRVVMTTSGNLPWFQVFTADPESGCSYPGRGRAIAVEPMSAPPNALRSAVDLLTLQPGSTHRFYWGLRVEK